MVQVLKLRKGSGLLVGGCYVVFVSMVSNSDGSGRVLRVRGDLGKYFSGCVDGVVVLRGGRSSSVDFGGLVSVVSV